MRKFLYSVLMLAAVVLAACSNDDNGDTQPKRGMTLNASVENLSSRATMTDESGIWKFAFTQNDQVSVSNNKITSYYTFTNNGSQFTSTDAMVTTEDADWYAYFPGNEVDLTNQTGTFADVANKFAVAGGTAEATTGEKGLSITLKSKVAVLRIVKVDNDGPCDIYLKTDGKYVKGLKAKKNEAGFDVVTSTEKESVFQKEGTNSAGIYYVVVPAGVKISVYNTNDKNHIKTTKAEGLTAGKYYTLTSGPTTGTAEATINGTKKTISWVQLWIGGPRIATENVADEMTWDDAVKTGSDYVWGANWRTPSRDDLEDIVGEDWSIKIVEVDLITDNGVKHFKYKGTQPGYKSNEVTIPFTQSDNEGGVYWTSSTDGKLNSSNQPTGTSYTISDYYGSGIYNHFNNHSERHVPYSVRPVLTAKTICWSNQYVKNNE